MIMLNVLDQAATVFNRTISIIGETIFIYGTILFVFGIIFGCIFYFTGFNKKLGAYLLIYCIIGAIVFANLYMWLYGTTGPPDITGVFQNS
ncbi:MAG: hypothetical protein ACTSWN_00185 [Promethearchaeota archaeon]